MAAAADCQLESIRRIQLLRAELEHSLRVSLSPPKEKRPLNILFRSDKSAQIQILGTEESALKSRPVAPTSSTRFTVSPTANAMPAMTDRAGGPKAMGRPLRVLITNNNNNNREPKAAENQQPRPAIAIVPSSAINNNASATSPASSVDSGIVSPGGDFLFGCGTPGSPSAFPSWATIPRTSGVNRRRIFNFSNCAGSTGGSLIDALALSGKQPRAEHKMTDTSAGPIGAALLTLQKPPAGKKLQNGSLPMPTAVHHQHQQSQSSSSPPSVSSAIGNNSSSSNNPNINRCSAHAHPHPMQRQMSEGAAAPPFDDLDAARRARAATMPPLKSILKKPRTAAELMSQQQSQSWGGGSSSDSSSTPLPRNHQRRMPTRMVLSRSISEDFSSTMCAKPTPQQPPTRPPMLDPLDEHFEEQIAAQMEKVIAEHQAAKLLSAASASPSACSTEGSEEASPVTKKRVSFSEQVHARIYRYRSNSSILGQRRKNEKKAKHRSNKRSNSDEQEESAAEEFSGNGIGGYKQSSPPICRGTGPESVFSSHMASNSVLAQ